MDIKKKRETFIKWFLLIALLGSLGTLFAYFKQDVPLPVEILCFAGILAAKFVSQVSNSGSLIAVSFFIAHVGFYLLMAWVIAGCVYPYPVESAIPPAEPKAHDADSDSSESRD